MLTRAVVGEAELHIGLGSVVASSVGQYLKVEPVAEDRRSEHESAGRTTR
ncbi:MAG: hypothetical protein JKY37_08205 [Nannocystaceae bacterium]|nr:hypothetical protein [Nannocystaceae bacterium]